MESNWAAEHLQVIRTLMERTAVYRRALAPVTIFAGGLGVVGALAGWGLGTGTGAGFVGLWAAVGVAALSGAFVLVRRQALKASEPFWSPPTRRVAQGLVPPLFIGGIAGLLALARPGANFLPGWGLPALWMLLYGCALNAAGFFMPRGIKLLGWLFIVCGCGLMAARLLSDQPPSAPMQHAAMGATFGGLHLAYGIYLYFTEQRGNEA